MGPQGGRDRRQMSLGRAGWGNRAVPYIRTMEDLDRMRDLIPGDWINDYGWRLQEGRR
ncbi:hypothetical protein GCM10010222_12330 [Streptomyces tanashiensis]|nr:hypothetical protein GCM10010222_12330 [Streptomyces tanashiensis]